MTARQQPSADEPAAAGPDAQPERLRWWQLVGLTLLGAVILVTVAAAPWQYASPTAGFVYLGGFVAWPMLWRRQRRAGRPVWWLLVVWPVAPLTFVGIAAWSLLELFGSF